MWSASQDYRLLFRDLLKRAGENNGTNDISVQTVMSYEFDRKVMKQLYN